MEDRDQLKLLRAGFNLVALIEREHKVEGMFGATVFKSEFLVKLRTKRSGTWLNMNRTFSKKEALGQIKDYQSKEDHVLIK